MLIDDLFYAAAIWLLVGAAAGWFLCRAAQRLRQPPSGAEPAARAPAHREERRRHEQAILDASALLHALRLDEGA